jgi:hypothetical protein
MASNTGNGFRKGAVKKRTQLLGANGNFIKRDASTGRFLEQKTTSGKFKGVRTEK